MNPVKSVTADERRPQRSGGPAQRVAPVRAVPRRERRAPRLAGAAQTTPARQRRPQTRLCNHHSERPGRIERKSGVTGKSVSVRVNIGVRRNIKKNKDKNNKIK